MWLFPHGRPGYTSPELIAASTAACPWGCAAVLAGAFTPFLPLPGAYIAALCAKCQLPTPSADGACGHKICATCGRCPPCDGPLAEEASS